MAKITILGAGGWGMALALLCNNNGHTVNIWSPFQNEVDLYEVTWRKNCKLLLKVKSMSVYAHSHL